MPVLVNVANCVPFQTFGAILLNKVFLKTALTVVLELVQIVVRQRVGTGNVQVPITIKIRCRDSKGIGESVHDELFIKAKRELGRRAGAGGLDDHAQ